MTDNRNRTPLMLAVEKNKYNVVTMLKETTNCQFCVLKTPLEKIERNNINIVAFFLLHFIFETFTFFVLLPCKFFY